MSISLIAQSDAEDGILIRNHYITKADVPVKEWDMLSDTLTKTIKIAKSGTIFTVHKIKKDSLIIKFWNFYNGSQKGKYIGSNTNEHYFVIDIETLNAYAIPYNGQSNNFTWGLILFPTKIRFSNDNGGSFNFTSDAGSN